MVFQNIHVITELPENIMINKNELARRLGTQRGYEDELIRHCEKNLKRYLNYKCAYLQLPVDLSRENVCTFDFAEIPSKYLYKNLSGCHSAFVMALTIGLAVDREMAKLKIKSQAEYFVTDALASTAAESFCEYAVKKMKEGCDCKPRFSPGYGDVSLTVQKPLLERLNANTLLGITLSDSYLMTPMKSITAIMGIKS